MKSTTVRRKQIDMDLALAQLNALIEAGKEFPDAFWEVSAGMTARQVSILRQRYDAQ